jgi:parallel beta-helix repeat protein
MGVYDHNIQTVDSVADLANVSMASGQLVQTLGYYAASDGGANVYRYDSESAAAIDGGFVIDGPGSVGRFLAVDQTVANVRRFGATGDGVTDDTSSIQAALNTGALVEFRGNVCAVEDGTLSVNVAGTTLRGPGGIIATGADGGHLLGVSANNVTIDGMSVNGAGIRSQLVRLSPLADGGKVVNCVLTNAGHTSATCYGIYVGHCMNTLIQGNVISGVTGSLAGRGIAATGFGYETSSLEGLRILSNVVKGVGPVEDGDGIVVQGWTSSANVVVSDNTVSDCLKRGIKINVTPNVVVSNNNVVNTSQTAAIEGIALQASDSVATGNSVSGPWGVGIGVGPGGAVSRVVVSGNKINIYDYGAESGIESKAGGSDISITSNVISMGRAWATATAYAIGDRVSAGDNLYQCVDGGTSSTIPTGTGAGIVDGTVTWDYVSASSKWGVRFSSDSPESVIVSDNIISTVHRDAIYLDGVPTDVLITGNVWRNVGDRFLSGANYTQADNLRVANNSGDGSGFSFSDAPGIYQGNSVYRKYLNNEDTTPNVTGVEEIELDYTVATVTNFDGGVDGQLLTVKGTANVTLEHGGAGLLRMTGGDDYTMSGNHLVTFRRVSGTWIQIGLTNQPAIDVLAGNSGAVTYNPPSLADGSSVTTTVTVTGASLGDFAEAAFTKDTQGVTVSAWVSAADTVSVRFQNETGGVVDLNQGTLKARAN